MRIDRDSFKEILDTLLRNKSRTLLTGFGIFWGLFMLLAMLGGARVSNPCSLPISKASQPTPS